MTTITPDEMKSLETLFMSETGTPSILLMEHAAQGVAAAISRHAPKSARVLFLCGPGNNGGDGYAASLAEAAFGVGMLVGSGILIAWGGGKRLAGLIAVAAAIVGAATAACGFLPPDAFPAFIVLVAVMAVACAWFNGPTMTLTQRNVPDDKMGRAMGLLTAAMGLATPIGIAIGGVAAEAMGINLAKHKRMAFCISSFFAGVGGGLFAMFANQAQAKTFTTSMTYEILLIVVIGGIGSISGSCIASFLYVAASEWWLRFLDTETYIGAFKVPFLRTGFRMVVFSIIIMIVVLFFRRGLMGDRELSDVARSLRARLSGRSKKKEAAK